MSMQGGSLDRDPVLHAGAGVDHGENKSGDPAPLGTVPRGGVRMSPGKFHDGDTARRLAPIPDLYVAYRGGHIGFL